MARIRDQQTERRHGWFKDQHGRRYSAQIDKETGNTVGLVTMVDPPTLPHPILNPTNDPETWREVPEEPGQIEILYDRWEAKCQEATTLYESEVRRIALSLYGDKAAEAMEHPTPALLRLAGEAPLSPLVIRAMRGGTSQTPPSKRNPNKYALGLRPFDEHNSVDVKIRRALHLEAQAVDEPENWDEPEPAPVQSHKKKPATAEV